MILPEPLHDEIIEVASTPAMRCRLRMYSSRGGHPLALVTEIEENPGPSITNAIEAVWTAVHNRLGGAYFALIEHYDEHSPGSSGESFDFVTQAGSVDPTRWDRISSDEFLAMVAR